MKMLSHLWYLLEELVALALFDKDVTIDDKRRMQAAIKIEEEDGDESRSMQPTLAGSAIAGRRLEDFATAHTARFFKKMHLDSDFLDAEPATRLDWRQCMASVSQMTTPSGASPLFRSISNY